MEKINRYPGIRPFSSEYKKLFFGRDTDTDDLCKYINVEKITVLFGKSGMGKSSLINAGVIPKLEVDFIPIFIRFGSYSEFNTMSPISIFKQIIKKHIKEESFLNRIENEDISLWQLFKNLELQHNGKVILLVFDQFEELFTYEDDTDLFAKEFSQVLNNRIPKLFRHKLNQQLEKDSQSVTEKELNFLETEINIKVLFSIRSDRMSNLNKLSNHIPNILRNCFELKPLTKEDAQRAIIEPSQIDGNFNSSKFEFEQAAIEKILNFLTKNNKIQIETFQLQLICQYIEHDIVIKKNDLEISYEDIKDINIIVIDFYEKTLSEIAPEFKHSISSFIENFLIRNGLRISLDETVCLDFIKQPSLDKKIDFRPILQKLVHSRLLRCEPNTTGGFNYELSHDTLIEPILMCRQSRLDNEAVDKELEKKYKDKKRKKDVMKYGCLFIIACYIVFFVSFILFNLIGSIFGEEGGVESSFSYDIIFISIPIVLSYFYVKNRELKKKNQELEEELNKFSNIKRGKQ